MYGAKTVSSWSCPCRTVPFDVITPITLNGWFRMRMIWPVGSTSGPKSVSATVPRTETLAALVTSCCVKKLPYFVGQLRISGRSTSMP